MTDYIKITGTTVDQVRFDELRSLHWYKRGEGTIECVKHSTFFDPVEEPCWQCWGECEIEI